MFLKNSTLMIALLLVIVSLSFVGGKQVAYANNAPDKIMQIKTSVTAIETAINTSENFTSAERAVLQTSLNGVKAVLAQLMLILNQSGTTTASTTITASSTQSEIAYIIARYAPETKVVSATVTYATSTPKNQKIVTFTLPQLATLKNFDTEFSQMRRLTISELARQLGVPATEISTSTLFTARNPIRNRPLSSSESYLIAENIGTHSIINQVTVTTGSTTGIIEVFSDQGEYLRITITRNTVANVFEKQLYKPGTYNYTQEVYLRAPRDLRSQDRDKINSPIVAYTQNELTEVEVFMALEELFSNTPQYNTTDDFPKKLLTLLTDNPNYVEIGKYVLSHHGLPQTASCFTKNDQKVLKDFFTYISTKAKIQLWPTNAIFYFSPQRHIGESGNYIRCKNIVNNSFF